VVLAISRIDIEQRRRAANVLFTLGTHDAQREATNLERTAPEIGRRVRRRLANRGGIARRQAARDPKVALCHVEDALAELKAVFANDFTSH
jgi:hypothetical protein